MTPDSSIFQALIAQYQDSIFYLLLGLSAIAFVVVEGLSFWKVLSEGRLKRALFDDPRAPFGWALVPAFVILLLAFVSWERPSQTPPSNSSPIFGDVEKSRPEQADAVTRISTESVK